MYTAPVVHSDKEYHESIKTDEEILDELDDSMKKEDAIFSIPTKEHQEIIPPIEVKKDESMTSIATHNHQDKYNITNISIHLNTPSRNASIINDEEEGEKKNEDDSADIMHTIQ